MLATAAWRVVQHGIGLGMIAAILAGVAAVMDVVFRVILVVCVFIPMIGKRHRHPTWAHLNQRGSVARKDDNTT
jgi:uncharacterized membrane protein YtjA (UPF0391 family)